MLVLDDIWYGNTPAETYVNGDKEYFRELRILTEIGDRLSADLSEEQHGLYEQFSEQQMKINAVGEKAAFVAGVRFGVKMMLDVLHCA